MAESIAISVGMVSGFVGGQTDAILIRFVDAMLALPIIMLALLLVAVIGAGFWSVVVALMVDTWARYKRFVRAEVSIVVLLTLDVGRILREGSLAFLGLGLPPGSWGSTIAEGKACLQSSPWMRLR